MLTTAGVGWAGLANGALLRRAADAFDVFVTTDRSLRFQQNLAGLRIAIAVLVAARNDLDSLRPLMPELLERLPALQPGEVVRIGPARA